MKGEVRYIKGYLLEEEEYSRLSSAYLGINKFLKNLGFKEGENYDSAYNEYNWRDKENTFGFNVLFVPKLSVLSIEEVFLNNESVEEHSQTLLYQYIVKNEDEVPHLFSRISRLYFVLYTRNKVS